MNSLILDTSTDLCIVALSRDDLIIAQEIYSHVNRLSETLLPAVQSIIEKHCGSPKDLDGIALGIGPGSYTGTRLGAAVAKSLAFGLEIPMKTFASPLAFLPESEGRFAYVIPARSGQLYVLTGDIKDAEIREYSISWLNPEDALPGSPEILICSTPEKLPETIRSKPCFSPMPNLRLLSRFLRNKESSASEVIELVYLGTP